MGVAVSGAVTEMPRTSRTESVSHNGRSRRDQPTLETHEHRTAKVIELVSSSPNSFEEAVANAIEDASQTTRGITAAHVESMNVRCEDGRVKEYRVHLKLAFGVEHTPKA